MAARFRVFVLLPVLKNKEGNNIPFIDVKRY